MSKFKFGLATVLAVICGATVVLVFAGLWMAHRAQITAEEMESFEWIHNDRCLQKIRALPEPQHGFRFAVLGDVQIGTARLPGLIKIMEDEERVDFIIQTGDISIDPDPGHYKLLLDALARSGLRLPMFVVPGNHDVGGDHGDLFGKYFGPKQLWFKYGESLFVLLDNSLAPFTDEQCDWLENVLEKHGRRDRPVFLFMHGQPIYWRHNGRGPVAHLYGRFNEIFEKHRIDHVFAGNWHGYHREERNGTVFVVNGRGGSGSKLVPSYLTVVDVYKGHARDRVAVLPPRVRTLARSLLDDWLIAHIGELAIGNRWITCGVLLLAGCGCVGFIFLLRKAGVQEGADNGSGVP